MSKQTFPIINTHTNHDGGFNYGNQHYISLLSQSYNNKYELFYASLYISRNSGTFYININLMNIFTQRQRWLT